MGGRGGSRVEGGGTEVASEGVGGGDGGEAVVGSGGGGREVEAVARVEDGEVGVVVGMEMIMMMVFGRVFVVQVVGEISEREVLERDEGGGGC